MSRAAERAGAFHETPLLFFFVDGVGLGEADADVNPFVAAQTPLLDSLLGGKLTKNLAAVKRADFVFKSLDASLGYPGLPQSATGQTALLTGDNGAELMKGHYGPWPGPTLKARLERGTIFSESVAAGKRLCFANAYPEGYFAALRRGKHKVNVPVYAVREAGLSLKTVEDYQQARAISADLDGSYLHQLDANNPRFSFAEAGAKLATIAAGHDLTFFDFWLSDSAGHRWSFADATRLVENLDRFLAGLIPALNKTTLLITSDHGNLENKHVKTHTTNPVPLLALGPAAAAFADATSLLDVAPVLRKILGLGMSLG